MVFSTRLDSDGQISHDGEYWMMIGEHGDSAPITPIAPIMGNWCSWCNSPIGVVGAISPIGVVGAISPIGVVGAIHQLV
ncbi:unnamed protein product [Caenorhabditis angaria]|uniref:Uncharacterized protein n=1 Tax=Caenorhabditis angaria TaxID=860376 RepID=A0A9P1IA43_9PELO|nr:unnamed protein product [Caenorhabditis angaria]